VITALFVSTLVLAVIEPPSPAALDAAPPVETKLPGGAEQVEPPPAAPPVQIHRVPAEPIAAPALVADEPATSVRAAAPPKRARPPRAIRWRLDPFLELGTMTVTDPGWRAFDGNRNLVQLGAGWRIDGRVAGPLFLGGGLRYGFARSERAPYDGALTNRFKMHEVLALLRMSIVLREGIDLVAELGAGSAIHGLDVSSSQRSTRMRHIGGSFVGKGGLSLYLPKAWLSAKGAARVTAGIDVLFGYGLRTRVTADPHPRRAEDDISISGTPLGDVSVRGFVWTMGVFIRVM